MSRRPASRAAEPGREEVSVSMKGGATAVGLVVLACAVVTAVAFAIAAVLIAAT